jgi:hypothetical protein
VARRRIVVDGEAWEVFPSGRTTVYGRDEFGLLFQSGTGPDRRRRYARYSPTGPRFTEAALLELPDRHLVELFRQSQPSWTAPESTYGAR